MHQRIALIFAALSGVVMGCKQHPPTDLTKENIIPKPVTVTATAKVFEVTDQTTVNVKQGAGLDFVGNYLADVLRPATGFKLDVKETNEAPEKGVFIELTTDEELGDEGYSID